MGARNYFYDVGVKRSATLSVPVICVGNLAVGGTGKTPMAEYILQFAAQRLRPGMLSRGYGRKSSGFLRASKTTDAAAIGDEPLQIYRKFKDRVLVAVAEDRALGIARMLSEVPPPQAIILDDGFQHRAVRPSFSIVLTDFKRPFYTDHVLPLGRLRENRGGVRRAQAIIVSKCPSNLSRDTQAAIGECIAAYTTAPVFFTMIGYDAPICFGRENAPPPRRVIAVSGVASPASFHAHAFQYYEVAKTIVFPDHYPFVEKDVASIERLADAHQAAVLTTEKDFVKLFRADFLQKMNTGQWYYQPIRTVFLQDEDIFTELLEKALLL